MHLMICNLTCHAAVLNISHIQFGKGFLIITTSVMLLIIITNNVLRCSRPQIKEFQQSSIQWHFFVILTMVLLCKHQSLVYFSSMTDELNVSSESHFIASSALVHVCSFHYVGT